ncbi:MAG: S-layer homology domain-containing protein [Evtepia sp.]|nr:S-layer homology domain-containing protein [Evtepia sp.]
MKKKLLSLVMALLLSLSLLPLSALAAGMPFTDVPTGQWYYNDVKQAVESGLINGKTATTYCPNDNLTYAEAVKLAACMHQKYTSGSVTLQNGSPWYQSYVDYAKANKIITKDYTWNAKATRAGYMEIFASALPAKALAAKNTVNDGSIPDVPMTHPQAAAIYQLYRAGIVQGSDSQHSCKPNDNIKRSEVAAILTRMMDSSKRIPFTMTGQPAMGTAAQASLATLRQSMAGTSAVFAAAYLGNVGEPLEGSMAQWLKKNCPQMVKDYPFLTEIPASRVVGGDFGDVYCVVPLDGSASVTVSPVIELEYGDWDIGSPLYQSKTGEPILVLCNKGESVPDTQVNVTTSKTGLVTWYPLLDDGLVFVASMDNGTPLMKDFSNYDELYENLVLDLLHYGWVWPGSNDLKDTGWYYEWYDMDNEVTQCHFLELRAGGQAELCWRYDEDAGFQGYEEYYLGQWSLVKDGEMICLKLDLTSAEGKVIRDQYPVLVGHEGLLVGVGANKTQLPFQSQPYILTVLDRAYG